MIVTFVSQCEHKALNRTRRVLDAFANRIGNNTWQTVITEEGLQAVKKLLRKTASKNTAVSCHWIRSRSRSEFLWVVGRKNEFNEQGYVAVNYTQMEINQYMDKNQFQTINAIQYAAAISALFHDFGKANTLFQKKLGKKFKGKKYEPYRHEWVSLRLFQAFVDNACEQEKNDFLWIDALSKIESNTFPYCFRDGVDGQVVDKHPLNNLPPFAKLVGWLILSHHKLPLFPNWKEFENKPQQPKLQGMDKWITDEFNAIWNSYNCQDSDMQSLIQENWSFKDLPSESKRWRSKADMLGAEVLANLKPWLQNHEIDWLNEQLFTTHLSRLCLILADHHYSSLDEVKEEWRTPSYAVYANTYSKGHSKAGEYKQQLDEHLIGVAHHAQEIAEALPKLNTSLRPLGDINELSEDVGKNYKEDYGWQDIAKKTALSLGKASLEHGFFGINMASTGKGKTRANAKIMYALGSGTGRKRFSVALGLRTLTLQTGREYRKEFNMTEEHLAIAVGGDVVKQLFENEQNKTNSKQEKTSDEPETGSESQDEFLDKDLYVDYSGDIFTHSLNKWTKGKNNSALNKLIDAPVLVCTIDHLMPATEATKGGKHIPAMLRLLTSDLVLDEPDDFGLEDLPALCRLVHWAGLSGSRVLLSTATMPPALANALFRAYKKGWGDYAKANLDNWNGEITCAWFDENTKNNFEPQSIKDNPVFKKAHNAFVKKRIAYLDKNSKSLRKGKVITISPVETGDVIERMAQTIHKNIATLHTDHCQIQDDKTLSIGLVRMANINPLVAVARKLLKLGSPDSDTCIHYCVYHSRYPLAVRSYLENQLDRILKRNNPDAIWQQKGIIEKIQNHPQNNHIFVVLASPVAEVGRDHDYDWAIVEPSSMRSIIQLAGRVLRHRNNDDNIPQQANILLLNENYKALNGKPICFEKPGFESNALHTDSKTSQNFKLALHKHDLKTVLGDKQYRVINAIKRITTPSDYHLVEITEKGKTFNKYVNLVALEHKALAHCLMSGDDAAQLWWEKYPQWCGEMQRQQRFRKSPTDEAYYLVIDSEYSVHDWQWKNEHVSPAKFGEPTGISINNLEEPEIGQNCYFWFDLSAQTIYQQIAKKMNFSLSEFSRRFGEVRVVEYENNEITQFSYHENLGLFQEIGH